MNTKKAWYRFAAFFIIVGLIASGAGAAASALESEDTEHTENDTVLLDTSMLPDNDTLFAGYIECLFYGGGHIAPLANYGQEILEGPELALYQEWKGFIAAIAAGGGSTQMPIPADFHVNIKTDAGAVSNDQAKQALTSTLRKVLNCLLVDCPYEFYWYDKTAGYRYSYSSCSIENNGDSVNVSYSGLRVTLYAAADYQNGGNTTVSGTKAQAAAAAAARAHEIVAAHAGKTDYEKLTAYKDEICSLVSYNYGALSGVSYGDPWQMIYVFDGDPSTNVVCEGYSKAFQYLCDMTDFAGDVVCYTIYGDMRSGSGGGAHMWNIVTLEGQNYLVDVTNSDSGSIGQNGSLFLAGGTGSVASGYRFSPGAVYTYDQEQKNLYGEQILTLASTNYVPLAAGSITNLSMAGWVYGSQPSTPTWDTTHTDVQPVVEYKERLAGNEAYTTALPVHAGDYVVRVTYPGTDQHAPFSADAAFTITAKPLTEAMVFIGDGPFFCTGQELRPAIVSDGSLMADSDYEIHYSNNTFPYEEAEVTVTGKGNYQGTIKKTFPISYIEPPQNYLIGSSGLNGWYTSDVTISARDWTVAEAPSASFTDRITCSQEGELSLLLYFKHNIDAYLTKGQNLSLKIDKTAPTGSIQLGTAAWSSFVEQITFGHYTPENLAVTITGEDPVSGILDIAYCISSTSMTIEELQGLASWEAYQEQDKPRLLENVPQIVYVRIRDYAGNTSYLSTDGILIDAKEPEENEKPDIIKPEIHQGIFHIPQPLAEAGYDTTEKIYQKMHQVVLEHSFLEDNWQLYDVMPLVSHDGGITWMPAAPENFPEEGLEITLPYPPGASGEDYQFFAAHMFSHEMNGYQPGTIEIPEDIKNTPQGIQFTVHGLSPVLLAWETLEQEQPEQKPEQPEQKPEQQPEQQPEQKPEQQPEQQPEQKPEQKPEQQPEQKPEQQPEQQPGQQTGQQTEQQPEGTDQNNSSGGSGNNPTISNGSNNSSGSNTGSNGGSNPTVSGGSNHSPSNSTASNNGDKSSKTTSVRKNPKTGDMSNIWFYELCMLTSGISVEYLFIRWRRKYKNK